MSLPRLQLQPISTTHYYTSGDVQIEPGAAIAPGVLIQADPGSQVIIQAGVCIGVGTVLHASGGLLHIGEGATLGAEVLLIGQGTIGANACVGTASTLMDRSVGAGQIVPPGTLLGDHSRVVQVDSAAAHIQAETQHVVFQQPVRPSTVSSPASPPISPSPPPIPSRPEPLGTEPPVVQPLYSNPFNPNAVKTTAFSMAPVEPIEAPPESAGSTPASSGGLAPVSDPPSALTDASPTEVYGQAYVQRFLFKMFPQRLPDGGNSPPSGTDSQPQP